MLKKRFMNNSWIIKNRKGLSTIVSTLIIILLVLVAAGITWVVVKSLIQERAEWLELGRFTLDLEIKAAQIENGDVTVVVVRRNPGQGNYIGMNFIFSDGTNSEIIKENYTLQELEERSFIFTLTEISTNNLTTISVAPIFKLSSGKEAVGDVADSLEVTEEMKAGIIEVVNNFEMLGYSGAGKMEYGPFSSNTPKLPEFKRAIVNPLDVLPGDNQTFTVHVYSPYNITGVTTTTELDNSILNLDLEKIGEYVENNETIEIWSANWTVNDVHAITYRTTITATDLEGNENSITLTWTDSCQSQLTHGGNSSITVSCSTGVSTVVGLDGGDLTINNGVTLTIDSDAIWVFNDGKTISPIGTITVNGQISKGNLYYTDGDGDGYAPSATLLFGSGDIRAMSVSGTSDCSDGDGDIYQNVGSLSSDNDQDGYTDTSAATRCVGSSTSVSGRTYYKDSAAAFTWLTDSQKLGTSDCNDANSGDWRNRYTDVDGDGYCPNSGLTCVGNDAGYRDSCTTYTDCNDGNGYIYRDVANLILDSDHDSYSTGSGAIRCVGAKSSYWYKDADGTDKWILTSEDLGTDCNDGDVARWRNRYYDGDGDSYGAGSLVCVGNHANYVDVAGDCCDTDANAKPGQSGWFTTARSGGCGGLAYDYDCNSVETKRWTTVGKCYSCYFGGDFRCHESSPATTTGWSYLAACGNSVTYITNIGDDCDVTARRFDEAKCEQFCYGGSTISRTQSCH